MGMMLKQAQVGEHHLNVNDRLMDLLSTYYKVTLQDDDFPERLTWCLENCNHKFRDLNTYEGRTWYFENDQDAAIFALKWASE